jgi:hypothetical protein
MSLPAAIKLMRRLFLVTSYARHGPFCYPQRGHRSLKMQIGVPTVRNEADFSQHLNCDVELKLSGPTGKAIDKACANALRALADRLEKGDFEDGLHPVTDNSGKLIGAIYIDYAQDAEVGAD